MSVGPPVIGAIRSLEDAKRALENLRNWIVGGAISKLDSQNGLIMVKGGVISSLSPDVDIQSVGGLATGQTGQAIDATKYYEIKVKGATIRLAVLQ